MNCKFVTVMIVSIIWFFCIVYMILYMISFESTDAYEFKDSQILEYRSLWYSYQHFTFALSALLMIMSLALIAIVQMKNYRNVVLGWTEDWEWRKKILPAICKFLYSLTDEKWCLSWSEETFDTLFIEFATIILLGNGTNYG